MSKHGATPRERDAQQFARHWRLTRRTFLGAAVATAAACSSDDSDGSASSSGSGSSDNGSGSGRSKAEIAAKPDPSQVPPLPEGDIYGLGIASGDPDAQSIVLWTRLVIDPIATDGFGGIGDVPDVPVYWEVASDEAFGEVVAAGVENAQQEFGYSVHALAEGLASDTWYFYRFSVGDRTSPAGRTRTMPSDDATVDEFKLAFASCQEFNSGYFTAYEHMAVDDLDMVVFLGDYIYERGGGLEEPKVPVEETSDLTSYRIQYGGYKRQANLRATHAAFPWTLVWDDHEVENNYANEIPQDDPDAATFPARRAAAYQAYWEHMPIRVDPPSDGDMQLYRTLKVGQLASITMLDGRQYRTDQVCSDVNPVSVADCPEVNDPEATMLGDEQEAWLFDELSSSNALWKVIGQQTVMSPLKVGDVLFNVDQWDGYVVSRTRLFQHIVDNEIENVVVLTGDIHSAGASPLSLETDSGRTFVANEFVGTSISSSTLTAVLGDSATSLVAQVLPDAAYINTENRGYGRCTITPDRWTTEYVVVSTVSEPTAQARTDARIEINLGEKGMRKVS